MPEAALRSANTLAAMAKLGIAISTYNRCDYLVRLVEAVQMLTLAPFELVVGDDGSDDGTAEWCRSHGVRVVTGANRGVAWNKNRALFGTSLLECDPILVMEDDLYPLVFGWEQDWIEATRRWQHVGLMHPKIADQTVSGRGTPDDPFVNPKSTAQCLSVSADVLAKVGFFDSRFRGWGHEHAEWTTRIKRLGHGYREVALDSGERIQGLLYIDGNIRLDDAYSYRNKWRPLVEVNRETFDRIKQDPLFRYPWTDDGERAEFLMEQFDAGLPVNLDAIPQAEQPSGS